MQLYRMVNKPCGKWVDAHCRHRWGKDYSTEKWDRNLSEMFHHVKEHSSSTLVLMVRKLKKKSVELT